MDKEQARLILGCTRPGGADDGDPAVREALAFVRRDPALKAWLEAERASDRAFAAHLRSVAVPASLKREILAGHRMEKVIPMWQRPQIWALAACVLILAGVAVKNLAFVPALPPASYADMQQDVGALVAGGKFAPSHEVPGNDQARKWLADKKAPEMNDLPPFLADANAVACTVMEWRGRQVGGMCLQKNGRLMHLFVINRDQLDALPEDGRILSQTFNGHQSLAWNSPKHFYVLVADQETTDLGGLPGGS